MKMISLRIENRSIDASVRPRLRAGFTLVEMLVVITIIGILVALVVPAALGVRNAGKRATIKMDVSQLEMACQAYKEKFGEYPPDFSGDITVTNGPAQMAILRHLARAFPRYQPGISTPPATNDFVGFLNDVKSGWGLDVIQGTTVDPNNLLTPATALTFWLGGCPQWNGAYPPSGATATKPVTSFVGFAADPTNPFLPPTATAPALSCPSRIGPFYDFNLTCLYFLSGTRPGTLGGLWAWPTSACSKIAPYCPIVYFRAENGNYTVDGTPTGTVKVIPNGFGSLGAGNVSVVVPAADWRLAQASPYIWVNPQSVQIFSSGLGGTYMTLPGNTTPVAPLQFPTGRNYMPETYDDITNFSSGTLEDSMKATP